MHMGDPGGGFIPEDDVVGKAWLRVWPVSRMGFMHRPDTFDSVQDR
jgi:signal peptidase I